MGNDAPTSEKGKDSLPQERGDDYDFYAGNVSSQEAWEILKQDDRAVLVDVRTQMEWNSRGVPDLSKLSGDVARDVVFISWRIYPDMAVNGEFCNQLNKIIADKDVPILFICRSGHRSMDAAIEATRYGYKNCYNITGGFEGDVSEYEHRVGKNGWKLNNLPWGQN